MNTIKAAAVGVERMFPPGATLDIALPCARTSASPTRVDVSVLGRKVRTAPSLDPDAHLR